MSEITVWVMDFGREHYVLQWKDPVTGKRRSQTSGCSNYKKALLKAAEKEAELVSRLPKRDGSLAFEHFIEIYHEQHLASLSDASMKRALGVLGVFQELMAPETLADITGLLLTQYAAKLRETPARRSQSKKKATASPAKLNSESNIATHMRTLRAALGWARDNEYIADIPAIPKQARARRKKAKGRPLTWPEVVKMLRATHLVVTPKRAKSWRRLIYGLFLSGLRLEESLVLTWGKSGGHDEGIWIDTSHKFPLLGIVADSEKGKTDRLLPLVPDFGRWLLKVPQEQRTGFVFPLEKHRWNGRSMRSVSKVLSQIGEKAGVIVNSDGKFASAHDLRRTFGLRWSSKVMPAELQSLMRHKSITTTMEYYAIQEATSFAERLWAADSAVHTTSNTTTPETSESQKRKKP